MSRSYRSVRPHSAQVYSSAEVLALYGICRNTLSSWVQSGLRPSDTTIPYLFRGAELKRFHAERAMRGRKDLRLGEFKCLGCGSAVFPDIRSIEVTERKGRAATAHATCCDCGAMVVKFLSATECDKIKKCVTTNNELTRIDESKEQSPACIGNRGATRETEWFTTNDRILHDWQAYAGRYDPKTMQAHLVSIRDFEKFLEGLAFSKTTPKQAGQYRDHLVNLRSLKKESGGISNSTARHRASQLAAFFTWLRGQEGYKRLSRSLPDYFALPRSVSAQQLPEAQKVYLTLEDANRMVAKMPGKNLVQRRDRAMVAFAYISGLRAGALTSVRFKHLDLNARTVWQDARDMKAKNGKSYLAKWFPRTEGFQDMFLDWLTELTKLGFEPQDAVFPDGKDLIARLPKSAPVEPLQSSRPLQAAFLRASTEIGKKCSPHSARHTLKALGAQLCRTLEDRKAWSMNLGHSDEQITERHYGKMSPERGASIMEALRSGEIFTEEENEMIIDYHEGRFTRGTDAYRVARRLAEKREKARGDEDLIE